MRVLRSSCIRLSCGRLNEAEERIADVGEWRGSEAYTKRERAALAWAEAVTNIQDGHAPDAVYDEVRAQFSEVETVNLTGDYDDQCLEPDCDCAGGLSGATAGHGGKPRLMRSRGRRRERHLDREGWSGRVPGDKGSQVRRSAARREGCRLRAGHGAAVGGAVRA